jgi:putative membrane-bound dehydrogenase-like protein
MKTGQHVSATVPAYSQSSVDGCHWRVASASRGTLATRQWHPNRRSRIVSVLAVVVVLLLQYVQLPPDGTLQAADTDDPKSLAGQLVRLKAVEPQAALKTFKLEHGFRLELVAAEPDVADPVDACFDADGRMYVAQMHGYPYSDEKRPQCPEGIGSPEAGVIRLLEDTNGDGRMDKSVIFADGISWPTSVCCFDGGVFVIAAPHIYYLKDTDGDDRADIREIVYSGFSRSNVQGLPNNLKWGLDNRIYAASGRNGATLTHRGEKLFSLRGRDIRFNPKTERLEAISGGLQFGHSMDDWGNRFVCSNSNHILHVVFPQRYIARNSLVAVSGVVRSISKEGGSAPVFRRSPAEPWRIVRTRRRAADPNFAKRLPPTELVPIGFFTSATGVTIYRGSAYPPEFQGNAFIGDVGGNLVHRKTITPVGASFVATRADQQTEFITSTDTWFRPTNFVNAPDGTLYILDMYRETIEHPFSIPADIKAYLDLESGNDRGRVWRLVPPTFQRTQPPKLGDATTAELVAQLESPNSWNRETAQRLLWERQDMAAVGGLKRLVEKSKSPTARLHALWTLDGLGALTPQLLMAAIDDKHPGVREHAVRLCEAFLQTTPELVAALGKLTDDDAYRVRLQVTYSLGEARPADALPALIKLAASNRADRDLRTALLTSIGESSDELIAALLKDDKLLRRTQSSGVLAEILKLVGSDKNSAGSVAVLTALTSHSRSDDVQQTVVQSLGEGLARRGASIPALLAEKTVTPQMRRQVQALFAAAGKRAGDEQATITIRKAAAGLLTHADFATASKYLTPLLTPTTPSDLQLAAVDALADHAEADTATALLKNWRSYSPQVRRATIDVLVSRTNHATVLLDAIEAGRVKSREIERDKKQLLLNHPNGGLRSRSRKLLAADVTTDRAKVVASFQKVLDLKADPKRGREVFLKKCAVCHKVGNEGKQVGPDLASTKNKSPADLLIAVLDPNREAQPNFTNYTLVTRAGKVITGMIAVETANSVTLRRAEGKQDTVLRSNIESLTSSGKTLMPEGLEKDVTPQQLADVIAFVRTIAPPAGEKERGK